MTSTFSAGLLVLLAVVCMPACGGASPSADAADAADTANAAATDASPSDAAATADAGDTPTGDTPAKDASLWMLQAQSLSGAEVALSKFEGKVALVVNVASECGLTPQYEGLQALQAELGGDDFTVLGFPSNDFGGQEPGTPEEIRYFCDANYGIDFPMFHKVQTKSGEGQSPIYAQLEQMTGALPTWNFSKYLISRDGHTATFFDPRTDPADPALREAIEAALAR